MLVNHHDKQKGFTVVEFIVILSIFAVMASVALFNFRDFSGATELNNLTLDIALEIKRAQTIGSSSIDDTLGDHSAVTVFFPFGSGAFDSTFEVYREFGFGGSGSLGEFEGSAGDIVDRVSNIQQATLVSMQVCSGSGICGSLQDDVAVAFMRPRTEPIILSDDCNGSVHPRGGGMKECTGIVRIVVTADGREKTIVIEPTGNIYVE